MVTIKHSIALNLSLLFNFQGCISSKNLVPESSSDSKVHISASIVVVHVDSGHSPNIFDLRLTVVGEVVH
jgi:hypothetical protein